MNESSCGSLAGFLNLIRMAIPAIQVDNAMKKGYSTYKQGADSPQVQGFAKNWNATGEQVVQQFKENINFVQEKGLAGTFEAAKKRAFAVVDDSFHFAQKGANVLQQLSISFKGSSFGK